jgi:hypothetical protein
MAYNNDELQRYLEYLQGIANRPLYKPDPNAAKNNAKQQQTKPTATVKKDTSKRHGLLDSLMNQYKADVKDTRDSFKDGVGFNDILRLAVKPFKYIPGTAGDMMRGMTDGKDAQPQKNGLNQWETDFGSNFTAGVGDLVKGVGDTAQWLGTKDGLGGRYSQAAGEAISNFAQKNLIDNYEQPYEKEFTLGSLLTLVFIRLVSLVRYRLLFLLLCPLS